MALPMVPIYTRTVTVGGSTVTFTNIPQIYADLMVVVSSRDQTATAGVYFVFNGDSGTNYSSTVVYEGGSYRSSNQTAVVFGTHLGPSATANVFSNIVAYLPGYTSNTWKQVISDSVAENSASAINSIRPAAGLWRNTSPITSMTVQTDSGGQLAVGSTVSLYGILRYGV